MHITNNSKGSYSGLEWTISRYGYHADDRHYIAWYVDSGGLVVWGGVTPSYSVRPVFYLDSDEAIKNGATGTLADPYTLK